MPPLVRTILKTTLLFCATGLLLATIAPVLAPIAGMSAISVAAANPVLWTGIFFGCFGAISATLGPVAEALVGGGAAKAPASVPAPKIATALAQSSPSLPSAGQEHATNHAGRISAERGQVSSTRSI